LSNTTRATLRQLARARRRSLSETDRELATARVVERILALPAQRAARNLGAYCAVASELDLALVIEATLFRRARLYLPKVAGRDLVFARWRGDPRLLKPNAFGIAEPIAGASELCSAAELDVLLVPLVAFDERCHRLGSGAGFYDRSLAHRLGTSGKPLLIGCAFECQRVEAIPAAEWDVPLDIVITESNVYERE
jgi:5-formyltetrahydrofolate cyclo-ligase